MTTTIMTFVIVLLGLGITWIIFYKIPILPDAKEVLTDLPKISVIIPARNEEKNLPLLLKDLSKQTIPALEIICVDDNSEDKTPQIALENGVKLISLKTKPEGWVGKSWACHNGAVTATGELLLFLDADVRLGHDGIRTLLSSYFKDCHTISVQPYHKTVKMFEQFSIMFNLVQIAANAIALPKPRSVGLYGPVILIPRDDYKKVGGHESIKSSIVDDIALGTRLKKTNLPFSVYVGNSEVSFRMYANGMRSLFQGWTKNISTGATKTPTSVFIMVFLWFTSLFSVPIHLIKYLILANWTWVIIYSILYVLWVCLLANLTKRIGQFHVWAVIFYPIVLFFFFCVMMISSLKKLLRLEVTWKGRKIRTDKT